MIALFIGIASGLLTILVIALLKQFDKKVMYGLILAGIGFLYVGYAWTDLESLIGNSIQAIVFLFLAYYGIKKNIIILVMGYFLHGFWDIAYSFISNPELMPPQYDWFCSSLDFIIGAYILLFRNQFQSKKSFS